LSLEPPVPVIDFHAHMPWWVKRPESACARLLLEADMAGVDRLVVIGVKASEEAIKRVVTPQLIMELADRNSDLILYSGIPYLDRMIMNPGDAAAWHLEELKRHTRGVEDVLACAAASQGRAAPIASYDPDMGPHRFAEEVKNLEGRILGVKIFPTFHMISPDNPKLDPIYKAVAEIGGIVVVHTGCDPGVFEFPEMCSLARPSHVERAARRHRDTPFIVAHLGAYSALKPGIYFEEALKAIERDNVYADTSASDPIYVEKAAKETGAEKLLFGSDYPYVAGQSIAEAIRDILTLDLTEKQKKAILRWNAEKLIRNHTSWTTWLQQEGEEGAR